MARLRPLLLAAPARLVRVGVGLGLGLGLGVGVGLRLGLGFGLGRGRVKGRVRVWPARLESRGVVRAPRMLPVAVAALEQARRAPLA